MFGIGGFELFLILIFGFLIFGPDKLPAIAKTIGKAIAKFRDAQEEMSGQLKKESFIDKDSDAPFKNPLEVLESTANDAKQGIKKAQAKADAATDAVVGAVGGKAAVASSDGSKDDLLDEGSEQTQHVASFAERKAQYDAERRARKEAEAAAAKEREAKKAGEDAAKIEAKENPKIELGDKKVSEASDADAACAGKES